MEYTLTRVFHGGNGAHFLGYSCILYACVWLLVIDFVFTVVVFEK